MEGKEEDERKWEVAEVHHAVIYVMEHSPGTVREQISSKPGK